MKRIMAFVIAFALVLGLTGCNCWTKTQSLTQEEAKKNFSNYEEQLKAVLTPYHLTLTRDAAEDDDSKYGIYRNYVIDLNDETYVKVWLHCNANKDVSGWPDTGYEMFSVDYYSDGNREFNLELFTDIVNTISGRKITKEYCETFLSDPEEKHPASKYGLKKTEGEKVRKSESLNFWDDWSIDYILYDDETEEFSFSGLTKEGTKKE